MKVDKIPYSIELRLVVEPSNTYIDTGIEAGILKLEEYENNFIGEKLNTTGLVSVALSNKIEEVILNEFTKNNKDYDLIEEVEYTFK